MNATVPEYVPEKCFHPKIDSVSSKSLNSEIINKKTYVLTPNAKKTRLNIRIVSQGLSITLLRNGVQCNEDVISFNVGDIIFEYYKEVNRNEF